MVNFLFGAAGSWVYNLLSDETDLNEVIQSQGTEPNPHAEVWLIARDSRRRPLTEEIRIPKNEPGRRVWKRKTWEGCPETPHDHVTEVDTHIRSLVERRAAGRAHFVSNLETGNKRLRNSPIPFGPAKPDGQKAILFSPDFVEDKDHSCLVLLGRRTRAISHDIEDSSPKKRRGPPAMSRPITKRLWQTTEATPNAAILLSDSDSSYVRYTYKSGVRRGDHVSSASIGSCSKENPQRRDSRVLARSSGAFHGNGAQGVNITPGLSSPNVQAAASTDTVVLTGLIADMADMVPLLKSSASSAAWGVSDDLSSTRLVSATIKPHVTEQCQLTATFVRDHNAEKSDRDLGVNVDSAGPSVDGDDHSSSLFSVHHDSSEDGSRSRLQGTRRGGWRQEEDRKLMRWRRRGEAWPWILKHFPDRTEGAVKAHWYMLIKQRQRLHNDRDRCGTIARTSIASMKWCRYCED